MQNFLKIAALVVVFLLSACSRKDVERSRIIEEAAVYSALINEQIEIPFGYLMMGDLVIVNRTYYEMVEDDALRAGAPSVDTDTLEDFHAVNKESQILDVPLSINKSYQYISQPITADDWMEFGSKYPNAISITSLSGIGFNKELGQALVYMSSFCGDECGTANIYFLTREGDVWRVESMVKVWDS